MYLLHLDKQHDDIKFTMEIVLTILLMHNPIIILLKNFQEDDVSTLVDRAVSVYQPDNFQIELHHLKKSSQENGDNPRYTTH